MLADSLVAVVGLLLAGLVLKGFNMLKTNCKKVMEGIKSHILGYYDEERGGVAGLRADAMAIFPRGCDYDRGVELALGGCFLCNYDKTRDFLRELLEESDEGAGRYDDSKVWELYCHLIGRGVDALITDYLKKCAGEVV